MPRGIYKKNPLYIGGNQPYVHTLRRFHVCGGGAEGSNPTIWEACRERSMFKNLSSITIKMQMLFSFKEFFYKTPFRWKRGGGALPLLKNGKHIQTGVCKKKFRSITTKMQKIFSFEEFFLNTLKIGGPLAPLPKNRKHIQTGVCKRKFRSITTKMQKIFSFEEIFLKHPKNRGGGSPPSPKMESTY